MYSSPRHQDALAHLLFGAGQGGGGGFVQLTGEVGTGKTTLCRCLLEQIPENTHVALILNPRQDALELLETVCEELKISTRGARGSAKRLVDRLNKYLLATHALGENVIIVIDEAQNLAPEALEQIRLLTNLETETHKLLQIILLGQPELRELLSRPDLRQLAQRITARYHLEPLNKAETSAYVEHRLSVAGRKTPLFSKAALAALFRASSGVPRLINVIAERALLAAYGKNQQRISRATIRQAVEEIMPSHGRRQRRWPWALAGAAATGLVAGVMWWAGSDSTDLLRSNSLDVAGKQPGLTATTEPQAAISNLIESQPAASESTGLLKGSGPGEALRDLVGVWSGSLTTSSPKCDRGLSESLHCLRVTGNWNKIRLLGLPVILELPALSGGHVVVTALGSGQVEILVGSERRILPQETLEVYWLGHYQSVWRMPNYVPRVLRAGDRGPAVVWIKDQLASMEGFAVNPDDPYFGPALVSAIELFQQSQGLSADGVVGPETLMALSTASPGGPQLGSI